MAGCGVAGNPQPPTLWLPAPVKDLAATRVSEAVHLHWTMPKNTTDKVALKGEQRGHVCWELAPSTAGKPAAFDAKSCQAAGDGMFTPGKPADLTLPLPAELTGGAPRTAAFYLELQNHAGKTAGPSNAAWVACGAAPAGVAGLQLAASAQGVVLHWHPDAIEAGLVVRLHRELVPTPTAPKTDANKPGQAKSTKPDESQGVPPPEEQTLEVDLSHGDPGGAVDHDAPLDHTWKYWAERVVKIQAEGRTLETAGKPSETLTLDAKDVFPPAVPAGLAVVADEEAKAMDLSWTPDTDADIAGYLVYRRDVTAGGAMERITEKPVVPSSYSDAAVVAGHRYAYAVSAVDQDGNESAKSAEAEDRCRSRETLWGGPQNAAVSIRFLERAAAESNCEQKHREKTWDKSTRRNMKYCRFQTESGPQYGEVVDRAGTLWIESLLRPFEEDPWARMATDRFEPIPFLAAKLLAPVVPRKIVCIGRNYREHAAELGNEVPKEPLVFLKAPSSVIGPGAAIRIPALSQRVDFEGELAVVIGKRATKIGPDEDVKPYIRGYTIVNDVTARDLQKPDGQWWRAKGFDTFGPMGPLVTDEVNPAAGLRVETRLNAEVKQNATTLDFLFDIPTLLRHITAAMTLEPGDVIPTGTPSGVAPMQPGDRVEVSIEGIGVLSNPVEGKR